jgi:hypothetical protein
MLRYCTAFPALASVITASFCLLPVARAQDAGRIRPFDRNPWFWQYKGRPVLLLGGSDHDSLFNHPEVGPNGLESHLDLLAACGGNYVRNTMSSRGEDKPWPFALDTDTGLYDLNRPGEEFWQRFSRFLQWTAEREIIVQIEVFDRFDYAQEWWDLNPFNPKNNINYTAEESGLPETVPGHPGQRRNPFFSSVPSLADNRVLLPFQQALVDTMLSYSLPHGHVLYCISNETNEEADWGAYWATYIRRAARAAGVDAQVTEMWDSWDLSDPVHRRTTDHPEIYTYIDISQNNHRTGQVHWDNAQALRRRIADRPRPINNVKMYGGLSHGGGYEEGLRRMWRNALGGMASARFHRPGAWTEAGPAWGAGLSPEAQAYIRSTRLVMETIGWPDIEPDLELARIAASAKGTVRQARTHVVYTREPGGMARLYVDGEPVAETRVAGDLSSWDATMRLALGGELTGDRNWRGTYHGVTIYDRALSAAEVGEHAAAGPSARLRDARVRYAFAEASGTVIHDVSGREPALDLRVGNAEAVTWSERGLEVHDPVLIATDGPAERLVQAAKQTNALTVELWITPADTVQSGPARIVTLSRDPSNRNFTLGQMENAYQMRLRTTATSANGLPGLETGLPAEASIAAARSLDRDRAAIFVSHGVRLEINAEALAPGLAAQWFDPRTCEWQEARADADGHYVPPSSADWVLVWR